MIKKFLLILTILLYLFTNISFAGNEAYRKDKYKPTLDFRQVKLCYPFFMYGRIELDEEVGTNIVVSRNVTEFFHLEVGMGVINGRFDINNTLLHSSFLFYIDIILKYRIPIIGNLSLLTGGGYTFGLLEDRYFPGSCYSLKIELNYYQKLFDYVGLFSKKNTDIGVSVDIGYRLTGWFEYRGESFVPFFNTAYVSIGMYINPH